MPEETYHHIERLMPGPFTDAGAANDTELDDVAALIAHELHQNAFGNDPDGSRWAAWSAAAATVARLREQDAANRRLLDQFSEFISGMNDELNILAPRSEVRDTMQRMIFNFRMHMRGSADLETALGDITATRTTTGSW
ncbi:hypothetical protein [Curtobacterium sp. MCBD17_040]|uniref:hypothetical protein n=1 Tax=Curtobacterium sp. MCBD17_040 TaxID=2175674 RepID=UPI000DA8DE5B|nr:hypothetical protein [Curtobacterium sp. MCBD17_040]WIB65284.1 hypothetical protein DEI94_17925 [Curtobacterium sp. MCBD17_040]